MKLKQISPVMPLIVVFLIGDAVFWWLGLCENNRAGIFLGIFILIMIIRRNCWNRVLDKN